MTDGVRRLSHEDAELLISARMDEQLDRADSRALLVHLQTCESCRAFAVQSEVLGRELATLPVLPPSALVDRQIRESIAKGRSRWSLASLMPATAGNSGLRVAVGALAMLTLVSVFLLVRMAGDQTGEGPSIDAPNGGVAQQLDRTPTSETLAVGAAPTETARVVIPKTPASGSTTVAEPTRPGNAPTEVRVAPEESQTAKVEPTGTLDPAFAYAIEKTKTPDVDGPEPTKTETSGRPTEDDGNVAVASAPEDESTPVSEPAGTVPSDDETPVATGEPTTPPAEDTATPDEPTETPAEDSTSEPTQTADAPTEEPVAEPTETPLPEPTMTETPVDISVDAAEPPAEPTTPPPGETSVALQVESPQSDASPSPSSESTAPQPSQSPRPPDPTQTPDAPYAQPTIAPISGQTGADQGTGEDEPQTADTSPAIVPSDGTDVEGKDESGEIENGGGIGAAGTSEQSDDQGANDDGSDNGSNEGASPQIVPSDGTNVPDGVGGAIGQGGDSQPAPIPTVDDSVEPMGLDLSDTVTTLPEGTTSPVGRLEFSPGMNLYVVIAPDGQLAVADLDGELVVTLGGGDLPVWSGSGLMFSTPGESGAQVGIWNSDSGDLSYIPPSDNEASDDVPIGGDGTSFYYLRIYPGSGILELRSATMDGSDNGVIWTSDAYTLASARPVYSADGVYLPSSSEWVFIDWDGNESSLGENPYSFVGAPILSPGGGLMAYSVGDEVIVAWSDEPGVAVATAPFSAPGGYAFATTGEEIVVSDGSSLHVISYEGEDLGELGGSQPIGACYWMSDTIYYLQIGQDAELKSTNLAAIQSD